MKTTRLVRLSIALATIAIGTASLTSCATAVTPEAGSSTPAAAPTYTADDLTGILGVADVVLGTSAKILDVDQTKEVTTAFAAGGLATLLDQPGLTVSPAACKAQAQKGITALVANPKTDTVTAGMTYAADSVTVSTIPGKALPSDANDSQARLDAYLQRCGRFALTAAGETVHVRMKKSTTTTTTAEQTIAIDETVTIPASAGAAAGSFTMSIVFAREGNLLVAATGITKSTVKAIPAPTGGTPSPAKAIDAVLRAAVQWNQAI